LSGCLRLAEPFTEEVRRALAEDHAAEDVTTGLLGASANASAAGHFLAEERFVVAGLPLVERVFAELDPRALLCVEITEGSWTEPGAVLATVRAKARALLAGERVALNFLQHLSGVATATRRAVDAVAGTGARITHTRKTTPGLRTLECYAVGIGGGVPNRAHLGAAVLWKDNHWALLQRGGMALQDALAHAPPGLPVIVEVENETELDAALKAGARHLLVDNQPPERLAVWARTAGRGVEIQASGGITPDSARHYAEAGATLISIGAITHSARAVSIHCELTLPGGTSPSGRA
jgi:nicotinate-nucleotide pyrophosphorylase (carboxylating)